MIHPKLGGARLCGRLMKSFATSAVALSALAGSVVLSGGDAKALTCQFDAGVHGPQSIFNCAYGSGGPGPAIIPGPNGFYQQWYETNADSGLPAPDALKYFPTDKDIWFISGPSKGSGDIEWDWVDVNGNGTWLIPPDPHSLDEWHVDVDFNPNFAIGENPPPPAPHTSIFEYVVIIDKGQGGDPHLPWNPWFEDVQLGAIFGPDIVPGGPQSFVTKEVYEAVCTSSTPGGTFDACTKGSLIDILTVSANGMATDSTGLLPPIYDKLYIVDTAQANNNLIDAYQNVYRQVPGPLPILGAGAAFGFSRKLRSRIKSTRVA
jgi:hypothetical protein